jgi:hypothetical protein
MLCVLDKKGVSLCRLKITTHRDSNHVFILGTPVYMVANTIVSLKQQYILRENLYQGTTGGLLKRKI